MGWVFDIADTAIFNLAKGPMLIQMIGESAYRVQGAQIEARIQSGFLLGWSIGGLAFGILADRWGRTKTLVLTVFIYCLFTGLTALCHSPEQVFVARFLTALGIGGEWAAGASLVAESFPDMQRPLAASILQTAAAFGPVLSALAGLGLAGVDWQWMFVVGIAPALFCVIVRYGAHDPHPPSRTEKAPLAEIFGNRRFLKRAIASMLVGATGIAGAGTVTFWQPNLVRAASVGLSKTEIASRTSVVTMVGHIGTLLGVFVVPWLCTKFGRRATIGVFFVLAPIAVFFAIGGETSYLRILAFMPLVNFFAIGVSAAFVLYFPELFPTRIRASGAGLAYNVGRVLSIPIPLYTAWAISRFGNSAPTGVAMSGVVYLVGLGALPFLPETKDRTLAEADA